MVSLFQQLRLADDLFGGGGDLGDVIAVGHVGGHGDIPPLLVPVDGVQADGLLQLGDIPQADGLAALGAAGGACAAHAVPGQPGRSEGQQEEVPCGNHRHGCGVARGHGRARQRYGVPSDIRVLVGHAQRVAGVLRCVFGRRHRAGALR